jgi:uncharacterized membrane protein YhaH (DUF805 family)
MNLQNAVKSGFSNYANFRGRAQRSEFWFWVLFFWLAVAVASILDAVLFPGVSGSTNPSFGLYFLPLNLVGYALIVPSISVFVRRLHDTDRKGWWWLITFIPFGGLVMLVWLCSEGTQGSNRFGVRKSSATEGNGGNSTQV